MVREQRLHRLDHLAPIGLERVRRVVVATAKGDPDPPVDDAVEHQLEPSGSRRHGDAAHETRSERTVEALVDHREVAHEILRVVGPVGHHDRNDVAPKDVEPGANRETEPTRIVGQVVADTWVGSDEDRTMCAVSSVARIVHDDHLVVDRRLARGHDDRLHGGADSARLVVGGNDNRESVEGLVSHGSIVVPTSESPERANSVASPLRPKTSYDSLAVARRALGEPKGEDVEQTEPAHTPTCIRRRTSTSQATYSLRGQTSRSQPGPSALGDRPDQQRGGQRRASRRLSREASRGARATYEVIIVDDGSTETAFVRLAHLAAHDERLRVIQLRRNYGQTAAMAAGFDHARGEVIVPMDGDLQNDPADIARCSRRSTRATTS